MRWEKNREHITNKASNPSTANNKNTRLLGTATTLPVEQEEHLASWVHELRSDGIPVSRLLLQCKALEVAKDIGLNEAQFKASPSWITGFIKRWKLSTRAKTRSGQKNLEAGQAALAEFSTRIRKLIEEKGIDDIYNADQTGINYEYIPKHTIDDRGAKTVWIRCSGHEKDRVTAMLLGDTKGTKYSMFLVLKTQASKIKETVVENLTQRNGFGKRVWPEIEDLQERHPSRIYGNPTAWWNGDISKRFLAYHFGHRKGKNLKKVLLLWDDFSAHFSDDVVDYATSLDVILEKIPPTYTWMCQPADLAWMKPMKAMMRKRWVTYLSDSIKNHNQEEGAFTLRPPTRVDLVEWINDAWDALPKSTIVQGFVMSNLVDHPSLPVQGNTSHATTFVDQPDEIATLLSRLRQSDVVIDELDSTSDIADGAAEDDDHESTRE
ncbi:hypothetical protein DYB36_004722 [Aphanomyces astaci]|uniref:HTH CENPB-type domain-containing protein n=1 Tax=Aphanomyces astaci TaxID=112090 RepID=A0A397ADP1_APHAT|nr:hypothetical protein DYB36_004722 [Aphanomyces astaci]